MHFVRTKEPRQMAGVITLLVREAEERRHSKNPVVAESSDANPLSDTNTFSRARSSVGSTDAVEEGTGGSYAMSKEELEATLPKYEPRKLKRRIIGDESSRPDPRRSSLSFNPRRASQAGRTPTSMGIHL